MAMDGSQQAYKRAWEQLQSLSDDDLYSMLAGPVLPSNAEVRDDVLEAHFIFERTREAIEQGRVRLSAILTAARAEICRQWKAAEPLRGPFEVFVEVCGVLEDMFAREPMSPVAAIAILICRGCDFSLQKLCSNPSQ